MNTWINSVSLILMGVVLDQNKEHELFPEIEELGYDVNVTFVSGRTEVFHNVTEIHWLYSGNRFALESDIHGTGQTYATHAVTAVKIENAKQKAYEF